MRGKLFKQIVHSVMVQLEEEDNKRERVERGKKKKFRKLRRPALWRKKKMEMREVT